MPRKPRIPSYRRQKQKRRADQAFVVISGKRHYLGAYGSPESKAEYQRLIADWLAGGGELPPPVEDITVIELLSRYWKWAMRHYRDADGKLTTSIDNIKAAIRWLRELFGETAAADFGPRCLKVCQRRMIEDGLSRMYINRNCSIIVRVFKWAVAEELVPAGVHQALAAVPGLQAGRTEAPEREPVKPVPDAHVDAVLPLLTPTVAAMVELQRCTGMRPAEVCSLRPADVNTSGKVWTVQLARHKTSYRGRERVVYIGPRGQRILRPLLTPDCPLDKPIFSPKRSFAESLERRQAERKTPANQGNRPGSNRAVRRERAPGDAFDPDSYRRAIHRACDRAGVSQWSPNRLRHNFATLVRREHGLEAAQVLLGHAKADVTQVYAEVDRSRAESVAAMIG